MRVSVAMATYNGEKYLKAQLRSIQDNLDDSSEIVVSDDGSTDSTMSILRGMAELDSRIVILNGPQQGVIANFENAICHTSGEIIFLADQDDCWLPTKVQTVCGKFEADPKLTCVLHDVVIVDQDLQTVDKSFFQFRKVKQGFLNNILRNSYMGSAMAFRRSTLKFILPMPRDIPMHDQWIGLINDKYGKVLFWDIPLGLYRRHSRNVSSMRHGAIREMVPKRMHLLINLYRRIWINDSGR